MKLVIVESPFAPKGRYVETGECRIPGGCTRKDCPVCATDPLQKELEENIRYARLCMRDCLMRGEAPFASHMLYTQPDVLDDNVFVERKLGMTAGWSWMIKADLVAVYTDLGVSDGMREGISASKRVGREMPVEYRTLVDWDGFRVEEK